MKRGRSSEDLTTISSKRPRVSSAPWRVALVDAHATRRFRRSKEWRDACAGNPGLRIVEDPDREGLAVLDERDIHRYPRLLAVVSRPGSAKGVHQRIWDAMGPKLYFDACKTTHKEPLFYWQDLRDEELKKGRWRYDFHEPRSFGYPSPNEANFAMLGQYAFRSDWRVEMAVRNNQENWVRSSLWQETIAPSREEAPEIKYPIYYAGTYRYRSKTRQVYPGQFIDDPQHRGFVLVTPSEFPGYQEIAFALVDEQYRGQGVLNGMMATVAEKYPDTPLMCITTPELERPCLNAGFVKSEYELSDGGRRPIFFKSVE